MPEEELSKPKLIQTSKMELTIPDPKTCADFVAKINLTGSSLRVTIPAEVVELLGLVRDDILEVRISKRKRIERTSADLFQTYKGKKKE